VIAGSDADDVSVADLRSAAVLLPVFRDPSGVMRLVMLRRAEGGRHGGQLAFPGGGVEPQDRSLLETALREAQEEIGLPPESVSVLADLPELVTRATGYRIAPFLARIVRPGHWQPDPREVAEVLEIDLQELARPETRGESLERFSGRSEPVLIEYYQVGPYRLWGASYRILEPVLRRLLAGEWSL
jgi:8-oxo-dGTP pyrophosphatase MutT (NUDIX family)